MENFSPALLRQIYSRHFTGNGVLGGIKRRKAVAKRKPKKPSKALKKKVSKAILLRRLKKASKMYRMKNGRLVLKKDYSLKDFKAWARTHGKGVLGGYTQISAKGILGGRKKKKASNLKKKVRKVSKWIVFLKEVYRKMKKMDKNATFSDAMKKASKLYKAR